MGNKKFIAFPVLFSMLLVSIIPILSAKASVDSGIPTVAVTSPSNNATVSGVINIGASASDTFSSCIVTISGSQYDVSTLRSSHSGGNIFQCGTDMTTLYTSQHGTNLSRMQSYLIPSSYSGIAKVEFYIDGILRATDTATPYSFSWDTLLVANGAHTIQAKAFDQANNMGTSSIINVNVNNVAPPPPPPPPPPPQATTTPTDSIAVSITSPAKFSKATSTVNIEVSATSSSGISKVEFYIDGTLKSTDTTFPYSFLWDGSNVKKKLHIIKVKAYDNAGRSALDYIVVKIIKKMPHKNESKHDEKYEKKYEKEYDKALEYLRKENSEREHDDDDEEDDD